MQVLDKTSKSIILKAGVFSTPKIRLQLKELLPLLTPMIPSLHTEVDIAYSQCLEMRMSTYNLQIMDRQSIQ